MSRGIRRGQERWVATYSQERRLFLDFGKNGFLDFELVGGRVGLTVLFL